MQVNADGSPVEAAPVKPELRIIMRADVHGSLEAILGAIEGLPQHEVSVNVISSGVGPATESDVDLAATTKAQLICFSVPLDKKVKLKAEEKTIPVHRTKIIYELLDQMKELMSDLLPLEKVVTIKGEAEILQVFEVTAKNKEKTNVAGCRVITGKIRRDQKARILRNGETIWQGSLKTLKYVKKDIDEALKGSECGMAFESFDQIKAGDQIQSIDIREVRRKIQ